jgi:hypothetical protein
MTPGLVVDVFVPHLCARVFRVSSSLLTEKPLGEEQYWAE